MRKATLLHQVLNFLVVFWVTNTGYDIVECTIETAVPENVGVALGIFDVSFYSFGDRGWGQIYPQGGPIRKSKTGGTTRLINFLLLLMLRSV